MSSAEMEVKVLEADESSLWDMLSVESLEAIKQKSV